MRVCLLRRSLAIMARLLVPFLLGFASCALLRHRRVPIATTRIKSTTAGEHLTNRQASSEHPMQFINCLIRVLWPHVTAFVRDELVLKKIEPMLKRKLGEAASITKFSLSSGHPPLVERITAKPYKGTGMKDRGVMLKIPLALDFVDSSRAAMEIQYGPVKVGLDRLKIRGELLIYVRPLLSRPPFIGGLDIAFENQPDIELEFCGLGQIADIPGLRALTTKCIDDAVADRLVLPSRLSLTWDRLSCADPTSASQLRCPAPGGVVRIKILKATDLKASDFGGTSDPYVLVTLGGQSRQTPTVSTSLDPVWTTANTFDFVVFDYGQLVDFVVFDEDLMNSDLLGQTHRSVWSLINLLPKEQTVGLGEGCGTLTFTAQWLDALGDGELINSSGSKSTLSRQGGHDRKRQLHYCGQVVGKECYHTDPHRCCTSPDQCDGVCGQDGIGCQCTSCHRLDQPMHQQYKPTLDASQPTDGLLEHSNTSMSDVHHVAISTRAGEHLRLSEQNVILSARLGLNGEEPLDVTQQLHRLILKGRHNINAESFDWEKTFRKAGLVPPTLQPIGVLRITVLRAQTLIAGDSSLFGDKTSDPYAKVTVGESTQQTSHISKTRNPEWEAGNVFEFAVNRWDEPVEVEVLDYDLLSGDDLLGCTLQYTVAELVGQRHQPHQLSNDHTTEHTVGLGAGRGTVTFLTEWRDPPRTMQRLLSVVYTAPPNGALGQDSALLAVCLNSIHGLRAAGDVTYKLRVEVETGDKVHQIEPQEAEGFVPWRDPVIIEQQIDNMKESMPAFLKDEARNCENQNKPTTIHFLH